MGNTPCLNLIAKLCSASPDSVPPLPCTTDRPQERVQLFVQSRDGDEAELRHRLAAEAEVAARDELDPDPQCTLERRFPFSLFSSAARAQAATLLFVNYFDAKSQDVTFCGSHTFLPQTPVGKLFQVRLDSVVASLFSMVFLFSKKTAVPAMSPLRDSVPPSRETCEGSKVGGGRWTPPPSL